MDEKANKKAVEDAARAVHETYWGKSTWKAAGVEARSQARQAVRKTLAAFEKNGLQVDQGANGAAPVSAAAVGAAPRRTPPPPPRRV